MLNRRLLRIKAMQNIYAFMQSRESDRLLVIDDLKQKFNEELLLEGVMEKNRISSEEKEVITFFENNYNNLNADYTTLSSEKLIDLAEEASKEFNKSVFGGKRSIESRMMIEVNQIGKHYLKFLHTLVLIKEHAEDTLSKKSKRVLSDKSEKRVNDIFTHNEAVIKLSESNNLRHELEKNKASADIDTARQWYRILVGKIEEIDQEDDQNSNEEEKKDLTKFEVDKKLLRKLIRLCMFKDDQITSYFEEQDINWEENKNVLKSMVTKTIKDIDENQVDVELLALSRNWEDDQKFFKTLFNKTLEYEVEHEPIITAKSEKWKKERIAKLDHILLQIAITEMREFTSIPVKVSINEYIEISKQYSTPKSWQYINGMLDAISKDLQETSVIRKSGRGLIDNR